MVRCALVGIGLAMEAGTWWQTRSVRMPPR